MPRKADLLDKFDLEVRWIPLGKLTGDQEMSCIDGRHVGHVLGAPGGDTGEFLLMLATLEDVRDVEFSANDISRLLAGFMDRHGRFYLHTDRDALIALEKTLSDEPELSSALEDAGSIDALVTEPPAEVRERLTELLVQPRHTGCGHLRTMLEYTEEFGLRRELVQDTIKAFYELLWSGHPQADFTILEGQHEESVIITFDTEQPLDDDTLIPSVCASDEGPYLFANHEAARRYKRRLDLELLDQAVDLGIDDDKTRDALLEAAERLAQRQASATISHLAPDLPSFKVGFEERSLHVDQAP